MGSWSDDRGNRMEWVDDGDHPPFPVAFTGSNGCVVVGRACQFATPSLTLGDDCTVEIGDNCRIACLELFAARESTIRIGNGTGFTWKTGLYAHEPFNISIGRDCLFSDGVWLSVSDMHSIVDRHSGARLNGGRPVMVGDRVWLGKSVAVLKGATIGAGSVIGTGSVVSGTIPEHCMAAGLPARVIREGIDWLPELV